MKAVQEIYEINHIIWAINAVNISLLSIESNLVIITFKFMRKNCDRISAARAYQHSQL